MASDPQIELRVSRLENDSNSIFDLISDIRSSQQEHSQRFDKIDSTLADIVRRLPDPSWAQAASTRSPQLAEAIARFSR